MKIALTGSLGHISKPLTKEWVQRGASVKAISRKPEKQNIEFLGAMIAISSIEYARWQDPELIQGGNCDYE